MASWRSLEHVMNKFITFIDQTIDRLGNAVSWLAFLMVLVMGLIVILRYAFQIGSIALQESVFYLNAMLFSCGASFTLKEQRHVRVDVIYNRLPPRGRALIDLFGTTVFLPLSTGFIVWASWDYVALAWRIREGSAESSGLPFVYVLKTALLLLPALLFMQGLAEAVRAYSVLRDSAEAQSKVCRS